MKKNISLASKSAANAMGGKHAKASVPAALSDGAVKKLSRLTLLLALAAPLLDALVIFPLRQIILSNYGAGTVYQIFFQATELFNLAAFFLLLALAVYCAVADSTRTLGRILALHGISSVFIVLLLRIGVYYLLAWLDSTLALPFELCNVTLNTLTADSSEMVSTGLSIFISQVFLFAILLIASLFALRRRQTALRARQDLSPSSLYENYDDTPLPAALRLGLIAYGVLALANQILDTVITVLKAGAPDSFHTLLSLVVPYFLLAIYCLLCYLVLDYGTRYIARECAQ
ncbi:MAG: hypothetical protein IJX47_01410 [Clostridia bacterium]|nr:hypothetical protein [Clostridia bacterium]